MSTWNSRISARAPESGVVPPEFAETALVSCPRLIEGVCWHPPCWLRMIVIEVLFSVGAVYSQGNNLSQEEEMFTTDRKPLSSTLLILVVALLDGRSLAAMPRSP